MSSTRTLISRTPPLALLTAALVAGALLLMPLRGEAQTPQPVQIAQLTLTPAQEVPPVTGVNAIGYFSASVTANSMTFDLSADGAPFAAAHIHVGAAGTNGPVVAFLFGPSDPPQNAIHPTGTLTVANLVGPLAGDWAAFAAALQAGNLYVNVHSTANPAGVIRAQIPATTPPAAATPAPGATATVAPRPPATGNGLAGDGVMSGTAILGIVLLIGAGSLTGWQLARRRA